MKHSFIDILREPDSILFQFEDSNIRFEEADGREEQNACIEFCKEDGASTITLYPSERLIKRVKFILAHTINDYIKNKNLDIIINEYFADNFNYLGSLDKRSFIITEEKWYNFSQEEKERYLEIFDSYNENYNNAIEALKYVLNEKDSNKYFIY